MSEQLGGKVAIVTGGASGLGLATVELFVKEGARVVIADIDVERGEGLARRVGVSAVFKRTDVAIADEVQELIDSTVSRFGGVHIMVNNAGASLDARGRFLDDDLQHFQRMVAVNLHGVMLGTQRAARYMARNGGGSIINTSSIAAIKAGFGVMTYRACKAGVSHFTKCVAIDLAEYAIRVNCIAPGYIPTEMTAYAAPGMAPEVVERIRQAVESVTASNRPLRRQGTPADFAEAALFLASERAAYLTGVVLPVDGGVSVGDPINHLEEIMVARARAIDSQ